MITYQKGASEIYFSFLLKASKTYHNGESPIVFRVIYRSERKDVFTGLACPPDMWMKQERMVSLKHPPASSINQQLHKILANAEYHFNRLKFLGEEFTLDDLVNEMKGKTAPPQTLQDYMEIKEKELAGRMGVDITKTTWYKYKRTIKYLEEYLAFKTGGRNIPVSKVNIEFVKGFYQFIRKEKQNGHNSTAALMGCLKSILLPAVKNRTIKENPFDSFVMKREQVDREFLELSEIKALEDLKGLSPSLELKRDAFLVACFTGLPYSDLKKLSRIYIQQDNDGSFYIKHPRTKNSMLSIVPLLPKAEAILKKYSKTDDFRDFHWKIPSNQKFNEGLKELGELAGIRKPLFTHLGRHTFATTVTLSNGVSLESVSKMLGHTSIKHTQGYAKVVASKVKSEMVGVKILFS
jgi:site-specific recombinase XerD